MNTDTDFAIASLSDAHTNSVVTDDDSFRTTLRDSASRGVSACVAIHFFHAPRRKVG